MVYNLEWRIFQRNTISSLNTSMICNEDHSLPYNPSDRRDKIIYHLNDISKTMP